MQDPPYRLSAPLKVHPRRYSELAASTSADTRDLVNDVCQLAATLSVLDFVLRRGARQLQVADRADEATWMLDQLRDPVAVTPCPECGGELYDNVLLDPGRRDGICPSCWATVTDEPGPRPF